jgi:hypothetical protein
MVIISPSATVMEVLSVTEDMRMVPYPSPVVMNIFLTGPHGPPVALKRSVGLFDCL